MNNISLDPKETLRIVAYLPDLLGTKVITQLVSNPEKYVLLMPPKYDFEEFQNKDFVGIAVVKHEYKLFTKELLFQHQDIEKIIPQLA